jgi:hypothetical protein
VIVALELLAIVPVVTVNVPVVAVAATVTDAGTVKVELVFVSVTLAPPVGAALVSVTVQVLEELGPRLLGLQDRADTRTGATRLTVVFAEVLLYAAVTVALELLAIVPVVTVKVPVVADAGTVIEAGTVKVELVFVKVTLAPPVGAAWVKVTVQVLDELGPRLLGLQDSAETETGAVRVTVVFAELLLYVAVIAALELAVRTPVVTLNVVEVDAAGTVTDAGTVRLELVFVKDTLAPPAGALPLSLTVQVELLELPRLAGLQDSELTVGQAPPVTTPPVADRPT